MRFFNTTGPVVPADHYCIPPLERLNFDDVRTLIRDKRCFVLHAPRQTGKTSALLAPRDLLNSGAEGDYRCVYVNVEVGQAAREDAARAMRSGGEEREFSARDLEYVRDLGLIARDDPLRIANPVYAEVVPCELTAAAQAGLVQDTAWYVTAGGSLDVVALLTAFQAFFREHSEHWVRRFDYQEAGPQLLLQAFLQRIVNGGGRIEREYGLGRGRTDLLIIWPQSARSRRAMDDDEHQGTGIGRGPALSDRAGGYGSSSSNARSCTRAWTGR